MLAYGDVGELQPEPALDLFERGEVAQVPYILGSNTEEAQLYYVFADVPTTEEEYVAEITETYGDFAERVLAMYPSSRFDGDYRKAITRISTDSGLVCGTLDTARHAVDAGLPVYMYNFNITWAIASGILGPSHAAEISHVFGSPVQDSEENEEVAQVMNAYWASFATTGDPSFDGAPAEWPRFMPDADDNDRRIQLDPSYEVLESFRKEECMLWREHAARQ
jgi:para-nitrobenzyl esterase